MEPLRPLTSRFVLYVLLPAIVLACVFARPVNHDESQYVAGAMLAWTRVPLRDFMILQPPLAFWAWAPVTAVWPGWAWTMIRLSSACCGLAMLWVVNRTERQLSLPPGARSGAVLLACCQPFLFTATIARNDALPGALLALGMLAGLRGVAGQWRWLALAGLGFGLAAAAKLSFLPSLAIALLALPLCGVGLAGMLAFASGGLLGSVPLTGIVPLAPEAFRFGLFDFALTAPRDWYGRMDPTELTLAGKFSAGLLGLADGPALILLVLVGWRSRQLAADPRMRWLLALTVAGLVGAFLPTPMHAQYLLPALPPLFVLGSLALNKERGRGFASVVILAALFGLIRTAMLLGNGLPLVAAEQRAHALGAELARRGVVGPVASLSPQYVADSGAALDPRFATGPFVFRSGAVLTGPQARSLGVATPTAVPTMFAEQPPAAILTGYEPSWRPGVPSPEAPLDQWARDHKYRLVMMPDHVGRLYVAPASANARARR